MYEQDRLDAAEKLTQNLLGVFDSAFKCFEKSSLTEATKSHALLVHRYNTEILKEFARNAREFGLELTLRNFFKAYHAIKPGLPAPVPLEPFIMETPSFWDMLETIPMNRRIWTALLYEQNVNQQIFNSWCTIRMGSLQKGVETLLLDAIENRGVVVSTTIPMIESLARIPIPLTRSIGIQLPQWEADGIIKRRWSDIVALLRRR